MRNYLILKMVTSKQLPHMALTTEAIDSAQPGIARDGSITSKPYKMGDSSGLYLQVSLGGRQVVALQVSIRRRLCNRSENLFFLVANGRFSNNAYSYLIQGHT